MEKQQDTSHLLIIEDVVKGKKTNRVRVKKQQDTSHLLIIEEAVKEVVKGKNKKRVEE